MNKKTFLVLFTLLFLLSCGRQMRKFVGADYRSELDKIDDRVLQNEEDIKNLKQDLNLFINELSNLETKDENLQQDVDLLTQELAIIQGHENIVEFIDPCGPEGSFDEIVLKTASGKFVAFFQSGNKRFLSQLPNGNYVTTDGTNCNFSISGTNLVD